MNLLVTGAAGFIGSNFVNLITQGQLAGIDEVTVLDKLTYAGVKINLRESFKSKNFKFVHGDICDANLVFELVSKCDAIVNFAAESHVDRSITKSTDFVQTNIVGVQVLLDAVVMSKRKIRFVQVSTDEVYGSIETGSWTEESSVSPNSPYSASKASAELLSRAYFKTHNVDVLVTRCSNNYGPHHFPEKLIPLFITNLLEGKRIPIYGDGRNVRDWLHVNDHCNGIMKVLTSGRSGETYNIGGGQELTNLEITSLILGQMGADISEVDFVEDRKGHDFRYSVDWSKIQKELGYAPSVNFEEGLSATIQWYRENEAWWKPLKSL